MLWVEGHISSYFLLVKRSMPTRLTWGTEQTLVYEVLMSIGYKYKKVKIVKILPYII